MLLTNEQRARLEEMERNYTVIWHEGTRDFEDVFCEHVIAHAAKQGIHLVRKKKTDTK
ncbi:hypothetical protein [Cohnella soli]|uniref:Uncharacterized protein n=1 Tax=Cohnella soli TaxID=425005 RepID=A0ABW0HJW5_9BACL